MKRIGALILTLLVMAMLALPVFAAVANAVAPAPTAGDMVVEILQKVVFPVLGGLILALLSIAIRWLSVKLKTDVLLKQQEYIEKLALQGIAYAEERAADKVKKGVDKISGVEKMAFAIKFVNDIAPKIDMKAAQKAIEAKLGQVKGAGATGEQAIS